jgi:NAD(P)-dependent dehydrogenase (short-subunit alcohol dehydrogenase family)
MISHDRRRGHKRRRRQDRARDDAGRDADAIEMTDEQWGPVLDVSSPHHSASCEPQGACSVIRPRQPTRKVVNVSSIGAWGSPTPWHSNGRYNVNVNAAAPGLTRTRLTDGPATGIDSITASQQLFESQQLFDRLRRYAAGRLGTSWGTHCQVLANLGMTSVSSPSGESRQKGDREQARFE